jgi:hypothetical protein
MAAAQNLYLVSVVGSNFKKMNYWRIIDIATNPV